MKLKISRSVWDKLSSQEKSFIIKYGDKNGINEMKKFFKSARLHFKDNYSLLHPYCVQQSNSRYIWSGDETNRWYLV